MEEPWIRRLWPILTTNLFNVFNSNKIVSSETLKMDGIPTLMIKYNKGTTNKVEHMLSRPPMEKISIVATIIHLEQFTHEIY